VLRGDDYGSRSGWLPTTRVGTSLNVLDGMKVRGAAYLGWRLPTLNELFRPFRAGLDATAANADLDPERLKGIEAGIDYASGPVRLALTGYLNRLKDGIANVTLGAGPGQFPGVGFVAAGGQYRQRQNLDAIRVRGLEASANWTHGPWSARAGMSLSHARVDADGPATPLDGLRPAQTPNFAGTIAAGWERDGKALQLVLRRVGAQYEDDLNSRLLAGATTLDAFASWPLSRRLQLVTRAENLTDSLVIAGIGGDGAVERATPRTLWIGVRLTAEGR